ncbi:hypothetical protein GCM10010116_34000 [Microbispora rosea subsp. aerata]|nr:hypothetical protein [Microbispora rosea]GGO16810.1 hypothetical protein GCM10010116_34000 [Microbispora rosea subsp. aerata]GIH55988.1 hypothetical protein Mro02_29020 [Microbispora rosea subsp. aerata]GLJ86884.1 hypothetical protein GCM10017588_56260 [Microbispora rosea subsp. aerata]
MTGVTGAAVGRGADLTGPIARVSTAPRPAAPQRGLPATVEHRTHGMSAIGRKDVDDDHQ